MTIKLNRKYITVTFAEEILSREAHRLVADFCPNAGAYMCDRRRRRVYRVPTLRSHLIIEDEGNIAAGDEPVAWLE